MYVPWYQYLVLWLASNIPIGVPRYHWYTCTYAHVYVHVYVRTLSWLLQYWTQQATTVVRDTVYHYGTYVYGRVCYGHTSTYVRTYVTARAYVLEYSSTHARTHVRTYKHVYMFSSTCLCITFVADCGRQPRGSRSSTLRAKTPRRRYEPIPALATRGEHGKAVRIVAVACVCAS